MFSELTNLALGGLAEKVRQVVPDAIDRRRMARLQQVREHIQAELRRREQLQHITIYYDGYDGSDIPVETSVATENTFVYLHKSVIVDEFGRSFIVDSFGNVVEDPQCFDLASWKKNVRLVAWAMGNRASGEPG